MTFSKCHPGAKTLYILGLQFQINMGSSSRTEIQDSYTNVISKGKKGICNWVWKLGLEICELISLLDSFIFVKGIPLL